MNKSIRRRQITFKNLKFSPVKEKNQLIFQNIPLGISEEPRGFTKEDSKVLKNTNESLSKGLRKPLDIIKGREPPKLSSRKGVASNAKTPTG